ncbi:MAG: hypothetical protein QE271_12250 [Bacteriovoracaceae bacterium]|nr:hypothetical protein [Bacteriovoracaceae bacterium]
MLMISKIFIFAAFLLSSTVVFSQGRVDEQKFRAAHELCNSQKVRSELTIQLIATLANIKAKEGLTSFNPIDVSSNPNIRGIRFSIVSNGIAVAVRDSVGIIDLGNDNLSISSKIEFNKKSNLWIYRCFVYYVARSPYVTSKPRYDGWITKIYEIN